MLARLSIQGIYQADKTIFDGLLLPQDVDRDAVILGILAECSELATAFPDPDFCKQMIAKWSYRKLPIWTKLSELIYLQYNPIENYDRYQESEDHSTGTADNTSTSTGSVAAFETDRLQTQQQNTVSAGTTSTGSVEHTAHLHGNIGVTTVAQMLQGELDTLPKLDIVTIIVRDFTDTFCIGLY